MIATALTAPRMLGLPFAAWTLDRLAAYLQEHSGIAMKRSRIDEKAGRLGIRLIGIMALIDAPSRSRSRQRNLYRAMEPARLEPQHRPPSKLVPENPFNQ